MSFYEYHGLSNTLPIILHLDTMRKDGYSKSAANWHENIELLFCIEGKGHTIINSNVVKMEKGSVTLINSGMVHCTITESDVLKYYCLIIDMDFLKSLGLDVEHTDFADFIQDDTVCEYFRDIVSEYYGKNAYYEAAIKGCVASLVAYLFRHYALGEKKVINDNAVKLSIRYINEHYKEELLVSDISKYAGFSRFYFSRKFAETVGCSMKEYIQIVRCRKAESLLRSHKYTVSEVSAECGFTDVSYFTKTFKKVLGYLPSKTK